MESEAPPAISSQISQPQSTEEEKWFIELKENLEALAISENISLVPGSNFYIIDPELAQKFEPLAMNLLYFANELNHSAAHQFLGILFEQGLVCSSDIPGTGSLFLQMFGAIYHYYKFINNVKTEIPRGLNVKMVNDVNEEKINNPKNNFKWHYHVGQKLTPFFSMGIEYEILASKASGIEARYLTSWALYYYDRSALTYNPEKFKSEACYNAGMIFKNGRGLKYYQNDPDDYSARLHQAALYFQQSLEYAPSLYELSQIDFGYSQEAVESKYAQEKFDTGFCWLIQAVRGCEFKFGPAFFLFADLWMNGCCATDVKEIPISDYQEILNLYQSTSKWYKRFDENNQTVEQSIEFIQQLIKNENYLDIIQKPFYGLYRSKMFKYIVARELQGTMSIILTQYLKEYSKKKNLSFMVNPLKTQSGVINIAKNIIQWPFKTKLSQILRNFIEFNEKGESISRVEESSPLVCQSIKQILVDEDEK